MPKPSVAAIHEVISYDPDTGEFVWLDRPRKYFGSDGEWRRWNARFARTRPAFFRGSGKLLGSGVQAAHIAWVLTYGEWPSEAIVHKNGDKADFRLGNLMEASKTEIGQASAEASARKRRRRNRKKRSGKINYGNMEAPKFSVLSDDDDDYVPTDVDDILSGRW